MDLKERKGIHAQRHPWETTRLRAVQRILFPYAFEGIRALDVGCGDGYIARGLFNHLTEKMITSVDIHLTDELIRELETTPVGVHYFKEIPEESSFDMVLLLDVLEHVEGDRDFLVGLVAKHVSRGGKVLITVPAFQSLYSCHDAFLGHCRRYRLRELVTAATAGGLTVKSSGYLFFSLLLPKLVLFKFFKSAQAAEGVGNWRRGRFMTRCIELLLNMDNSLLLAAGRLGIRIPGLTGWVLCEKQG